MPEPATDPVRDIDRYRDYLLLLARARVPARLRAIIDPSDVVGQTLVCAIRDRVQFRGATGAEFAGWLRRILVNQLAAAIRYHEREVRNVHRVQSLQAAVEESSARLECWLADGSLPPPARAERNEQVLLLAEALGRLTEAEREAVELRYFQGLPVKAAAEVMCRHPKAVAGLLHRGLARLRAFLERPTPRE